MLETLTRRHSESSPWTYADLDALQRERADQLRADPDLPGLLILSELAPVVTLGRRQSLNQARVPEESSTIPRYPTDRGGCETYHGPGQWVLFPVERMERLTGSRLGIGGLVDRLLAMAKASLNTVGVETEIRDGVEKGLWTPSGKKIASIGLRVDRGVILHGIAINVFQTAESFLGINPCGLEAEVGFAIREMDLSPAEREEFFERLRLALLEQFRISFSVTLS